jgi:small GTP-binding protein
MNSKLVKVVVAGDGNVGKSTLIRCFTEGRFQASRVTTIGVDFHTHTVPLPDGEVKLSIWDMAGQERFGFMRPGFYPGSLVAALVYDVTSPESFDHLGVWRAEILRAVPHEKFIVVGNKIDLVPALPQGQASSFAREISAPYLETSAKSLQGVQALFTRMAELATAQP